MMRSLALAGVVGMLIVAADAQIVGNRGDGTGRYPDAKPPVTWEFGSPIEGITWQAARPADDKPAGKPLADGVIRSWLVAGPFDAPKDATADTGIVKGEADFSPAVGDKVGEVAWKEMAAEGSYLNLAALFDKKADAAVYAHAALYAPADATVTGNLIVGGRTTVWLNGKPLIKPPNKTAQFSIVPLALPLTKGWNRLVIRTMPATTNNTYTAYLYASFRGDPKAKPSAKNILWSTSFGGPEGPVAAGERMISYIGGAAAPIIVGDKLFLQAEPYDLVCLDKNTGKVLWARSNNYFEATSEADRKGKPEFDEASKLASEINKLNDAWGAAGALAKEQVLAKDGLHRKLYDTMKKIDEVKYTFTKEQDLGMAGFTPTSDGKLVWAWYASGIAACYDLDGNRKWIALDNRGYQHHGFHTSPLLVDGKLIVYLGDIRCLDAATGKQLWVKTICKEPKDHWYAAFEGSFCPLNVGGVAMFMTPNGDIDRAADGEKVFGDAKMSSGLQRPTPVAAGDTVYKLDSGGTLHIVKLPKDAGDKLEADSRTKVKLDPAGYRMFFGDCWQASPVVHDGLVYCLHNTGLLSVVDAAKAEVVYQRLLDLDVTPGWSLIAPNLAVAGGKIYATGCTGTVVVFEPGREFKQIARNRVAAVVGLGQWWQRSERFAASPIFDGKRIYLRGEASLYCIEEK
ncbi:MAG: PQQ-binding-like beta-propeller repeat protein [Phycisphaerae bacterium]